MNNMNSVRTLFGTGRTEITFGSNQDIEHQMMVAGFIPAFILNNKSDDLRKGVIAEYGYPIETNTTGFLLDDQGNYLYDNYEDDAEFFDPVLEPILLVIDHSKQAFMLQYPYGICVFGNTTGSLSYVRMD